MQWSGDRNAGFSRADFARLYLPPIMDPVHSYQAINVEAQLRNPSSLLHWVQQRLAIRRKWPVFGKGSFETLNAPNPAIFAFLRHLDETTVLCVNNLSHLPQPVELDLSRYNGRTPVEITSDVRFPPIGELPYLLTLAPHGFYWFNLA
jgi:maltose alpha-D-glucosyltransferase/alpha-amylase